MGFFTLQFPNFITARASAIALGFWDVDNDILRVSGQSQRTDGTWYGWAIDDIGQDPVTAPGQYDSDGNEIEPPTRAIGYFVNVAGQLPEEALVFLAPGGYGCAGRLFAGTEPAPHT